MRITTTVIVFYIYFTAAVNLIEVVGLTDAMGVAATSTAGSAITDAVSALGDIEGGGIAQESLLGIYTVVTGSIEAFVLGLTAGPRLLMNIGVPIEFVLFLHAPLGLFAGRLLIYALSGRDL